MRNKQKNATALKQFKIKASGMFQLKGGAEKKKSTMHSNAMNAVRNISA